ncbi:MAG: hypothetical protein KKA07_01635 [Bacteroidetes bacterium]|nr:hypothetical protein [Bacteroidota bacterium]MBU1717751.1 hypothetical protein [Bacteroidota bacterium]
MSESENHSQAIKEIRDMMERSSRFISLSGLSGIAVGILALLGAAAAYVYLKMGIFDRDYYEAAFSVRGLNLDFITFFLADALTVLVLSIFGAIFFTVRNARKKQLPVWSKPTKLLLLNLFIPLAVGGIFCLILLYHGLIELVAPATLLFYGLALINASKYTFRDIFLLGVVESFLGLLACIFVGYGLLFWALGFGVLHIVYGFIMYFKYESCKTSSPA